MWNPLFDLEREQLDEGPILFKLSSLPLQHWMVYVFPCIRDDLRTYLEFHKSYLEMGEMSHARVLYYLDTRDELVANLILHYLGYV